MRTLNVAAPANGNLMTDSTVIWSGTLPWGQTSGCFSPDEWPPQLSADGTTITCVALASLANAVDRVRFLAEPLTAAPTAASQASVDYQVTWPPQKLKNGKLSNPGGDADILWVSPSAGTLIVESVPGGNLSPPTAAYFGVVSHGKYTPLQMSKSLAGSTVMAITF